MLRRLHLLIVTLSLAAAAFVNTGVVSAQTDRTRIIAHVDDDSISVERFNALYVQHLIQTGQNDTRTRRYLHLNDMIDMHLLAEEGRRRGLEDAEFLEYIDLEIRKVVGGRFFEIAFADSFPEPSEADVIEAFRRTKEKVILRHLFFSNPDQAQAAYERLEAGEDFLMLANEIFETTEFDSSAGYLGVAEYWDLDDAVAEVAFGLPVNGYSEPVRSRYGWHVLHLEDRIRNPILTQDEFERRREDIGNRVRARRFRLEGSRFVRTFMESLDVEIDTDAMHALREAVLRTVPGSEMEAGRPQRVSIESHEVTAIRNDFSGETILATYQLNGQRIDFTARDYFEWMPHLPFGEIRNRTAASVGRALRNSALAEQGLSLGLQDDPRVLEEVEHRASLFLAEALRTRLRTQGDVEPTESELREAFERLDFRTLKKAEANFWHIDFEDFTEAETAKNEIASGARTPDSYTGYAQHHGFDLRDANQLAGYVRRAPLSTPVVVGTGDGSWHVVQVDERQIEYTTFEDARADVEDRLAPYLPEIRLLPELRDRAVIEVNEDLFEEIMILSARAPAEQ